MKISSIKWLGLLISSGFLILLTSKWDPYLTQHLRDRDLPFFSTYMGQSIFEKKTWGASDFGITFAIVSGLTYFFLQMNTSLRSYPLAQFLRKFTSYVTCSSVLVGLGLVHLTKLVIGRARPFEVLGENIAAEEYSLPFEFGPHSIYDGFFSGSFPSGHTMTVLTLLTLPIFGLRHSEKRLVKALMAILLTFILLLSVSMGAARIMSFDHWPSDVIASIVFSLWGFFAMDAYFHRKKLYRTNLPVFAEIWACRPVLFGGLIFYSLLFTFRGILLVNPWTLVFLGLAWLNFYLLRMRSS